MKLLPVLMLALILPVSGCVKSIPDCGEDIDCFIAAADTCGPASVTINMSESTRMFVQLMPSGGLCTEYMRVSDTENPELDGLEATCVFPPNSEISAALTDQDIFFQYCTGTYVDFTRNLIELLEQSNMTLSSFTQDLSGNTEYSCCMQVCEPPDWWQQINRTCEDYCLDMEYMALYRSNETIGIFLNNENLECLEPYEISNETFPEPAFTDIWE